MREEEQEEWVAYARAVSILGDIVQCRYCNHNMIAEESAVHLIENHKKEADEVKKLCRKRLDWEKKALTMSNATIESMQ